MSASGIDSMFFGDVSVLAEQVDEALVAIKSESEDRSAIDQLALRLRQLQDDDADGVALRLLLTLTDQENRSMSYWSDVGAQLANDDWGNTITALEELARSLENEQTQLEERLRQIG